MAANVVGKRQKHGYRGSVCVLEAGPQRLCVSIRGMSTTVVLALEGRQQMVYGSVKRMAREVVEALEA
jgi:hypothetical protein